jgi:EAL domain-containing protein (putative c-di-GMP-specific phosphodiesterase class I)
MSACWSAFGQDSKDDIIQKLISRVEALEHEVAALKHAVPEQLAATPHQSLFRRRLQYRQQWSKQQRSRPMLQNQFRPVRNGSLSMAMQMSIFFEIQTGLPSKEFEVGELDLFATARITPKLSALVEAVFQEDTQVYVGNVPINLERILLQYKPGEFFNLDLGSYRTRQGAEWLRAGYEVPRIAVNVSAVQLIEKGFGSMVERVLKQSRFPAPKLELEITETALMNNLDRASEQIEALRNLGVRFSIDDFGTGYSSLSHLRTVPVDCVKIDRSFIKDLVGQGSGGTTLVRGIIGLAHNLELQVVAEGVETQEQLTLLESMGCDINQGFFLHRPMPCDAVEKLLKPAAQALESVGEEVPVLGT